MSNNMNVMVVGSGYMGKAHSKVLIEKGYKPLIVGRGIDNAKKLEDELHINVITGGLEKAIKHLDYVPQFAIVAVNVDFLASTTKLLIENGVKHILVEKPAGVNDKEIQSIADLSNKYKADVYVAYNRRFFASTDKALEIINQDGGVSSFHFEFTEWSSTIEKTPHSVATKEAWMLANSTHVIDLAFFLGGFPREISSYIGGSLSWHPRCSCYVGAGITDKNALFSYCANWNAPGRWSVEIMTTKHRLYFKPMEQLSVQNINTVKILPVGIQDELDIKFKPGLYKQVEAFLEGKGSERLVSIDEQLKHMEWYSKIARI